jgi:SAM-dependent methyltransferase
MEPEVRAVWGKGESDVLAAYRRVWARKPLLARVYREWWDAIVARLGSGPTLEVGAGIGEFRRHYRGPCVSIDVLPGADVHALADGEALPFRDGHFANVVCVDVVHHIGRPELFLREAARVLCLDGHLVCVEPYVSPFGFVVRRLFHHEEADLHHAGQAAEPKREALAGHLGTPTRMFVREPENLARLCPSLRLVEQRVHSMFLYPLSGGFTYRSLVPGALVPVVAGLERLAPLRRLFALKMLIVLAKVA